MQNARFARFAALVTDASAGPSRSFLSRTSTPEVYWLVMRTNLRALVLGLASLTIVIGLVVGALAGYYKG